MTTRTRHSDDGSLTLWLACGALIVPSLMWLAGWIDLEPAIAFILVFCTVAATVTALIVTLLSGHQSPN